MPTKWYTPEEMIQHLRTVVLDACRKLGITEQPSYRWKQEDGGLRVDQAKRLKGLVQESLRLKRIVAEHALDRSILKDTTALETLTILANVHVMCNLVLRLKGVGRVCALCFCSAAAAVGKDSSGPEVTIFELDCART